MIVLLPDHSGFDLNLLLYYNQHSEDPKRVLYTLRSPVEGDPPLKFTAKCSGAAFVAAIERAQCEAIAGADIALPAFDLEAAFGRLEALIKAPATEEQVERSLRLNLAVAQRLAESGEPVTVINLRAEFDRIRVLMMSLRDELAAHRRTE